MIALLSKLRKWWNPFSERFAKHIPINPNAITIFTPIFGALAGYYLYLQKLRIASFFILLSGFVDLLDGAVARATGRKTKFGAIFDATMDRLSEGLIYLGAAFSYTLPAVLALIFSYLVSYVRAKDDRIKVGVAERSERILLLSLFVFFGKVSIGLYLVALLAFITTIQRLLKARELLKA